MEQDLGIVFTDFARPLVRLARARCWNRSDGEDCVAEVFRRIVANPALLVGSVKAYLTQAVINECIRKNLSRKTMEPVDAETQVFAAQPADSEVHLEIEAAVRALPEGQRDVFILKTDSTTRTMSEVAECLEIPESTAASRYRHAVESLRQRLKDLQEELR
ncbi:MAG: hypothetical protein IT452_20180 [Planctomycetia bacterium]|nr:hypothetical protein [Planctomycetia bacterium]